MVIAEVTPEQAPTIQDRKISQLQDLVEQLPAKERALFSSHFKVGLERSLEGHQIVPCYDNWQLTEARFCPDRAKRPQVAGEIEALYKKIMAREGQDQFCQWQEQTRPNPLIGRVTGQTCRTAINIAPYSAYNDVLIFNTHDPMKHLPDQDEFMDRLEVSNRWFAAIHGKAPAAIYPYLMQNQLGKAGASVYYHGHINLLLTESPMGGMRKQVSVANSYHQLTGEDYFKDRFAAHQAVGLGLEKDGVMVFPELVPFKEKEITIYVPSLNPEAREIIFKVFDFYTRVLGVRAFNFVINFQPLENIDNLKRHSPYIIHLLDRGNPTVENSDVGASEIWLSSIVSHDPYELNQLLTKVVHG